MTVTARRMRMGARTITTGKQLRGQLTGLSTHVGPNALLRSSSYPAISSYPAQAGGASGPLTAVPFTGTYSYMRIDGSSEFGDGGICTNWAGAPTSSEASPAYVYNNNPSNLGGIVPSGGMTIDGFFVPANSYVFQFMDISWGGADILNGAPALVFRGCRARGGAGATGFWTLSDSGYAEGLWFLYCDSGGLSGADLSTNCIKATYSGGVTLYRCYLSATTTAFQPITSTGQIDFLECFIEELAYQNYGDGESQTHLNGVTLNGNQTNCRVLRNNIVIGQTDLNGHVIQDTDCISFFQDVVDDVTPNYPGTGTNPDGTVGYQVIGNYMGGTGYCLYLPDQQTVSNFYVVNNLITASIWPVGSTEDDALGGGGGWEGPVTDEPTWDAVTGSQVGNHQANNLWADGEHAGLSFM